MNVALRSLTVGLVDFGALIRPDGAGQVLEDLVQVWKNDVLVLCGVERSD